MLSKYYFELSNEVKNISKSYNKEEKSKYPRWYWSKRIFYISIILFYISYILFILFPLIFKNIYWYWGIISFLVIDFIILVITIFFIFRESKRVPNIYTTRSEKLENYIRKSFPENPINAVDSLIEECQKFIENRQRKFSIISKASSLILSIAILPVSNSILKSSFNNALFNELQQDTENIVRFVILLFIILLVIIFFIWLWDIIIYDLPFGANGRNINQLALLIEVRYLMYKGKNSMTKRALISVSDKTGIVEFAKELKALGWDIISTGGTKVALDNEGVGTIAIDDVTGFPEMMDGRVKTLHPNIHGGLLARRDLDSHLQAAKENQIELIDLVVVNLYPFKETILKPGVEYADAVENIDIGGPSMLRSAAKNHASVTVVVDPADYALVLEELAANGQTTYETRQRLAAKVFRHTAAYDALIADYFTNQVGESKPEKLTLTYELKQPMRYGENPQQDADFYQTALPLDYSIASAKQLNGKELSFNNIRDADAAIRIIRDFKDRPTVVALKHMNPCGIGQADDIETAWDYAYESDPVSIFGGIVVLNREVDAATAEKMHGIFLEIIIAPSYTAEALAILTNKKKNLRILELAFDAQAASGAEKEVTGVLGGLLVQNQDVIEENPADWQVVTKRQPSEQERVALEFAWKSVKYVKSNGIIITNDRQVLGVGPGQTNRVASVKIAIEQAKDRLDGAALASDAFFPFADNIEEIAAAGIKAIIQPGGSVRDEESIIAADKHGLTMIFTGVRHFRH